MRNNVWLIAAVVIGITLAAALIAWGFAYEKKVKAEHPVSRVETVETKEAEGGKAGSDDRNSVEKGVASGFSQEGEKKYQTADRVTVELVERTITEEEGEIETSYENYLLSEVDLKNQMDSTRDYSGALNQQKEEVGEGEQKDFAQAFGVTYVDLDGLELYEKLAEEWGFDGDKATAALDEGKQEATGQKLYIYDKDCRALMDLMKGAEDAEVLEKQAGFRVGEDGQIECFTAKVRYRDQGKEITKSRYLSVTVENPAEEEG